MSDLPASTRTGHFLAKLLGIQVDYRREVREDQSISSSETFVDREPTAKEWLSKFIPTTAATKAYILSLFPFLQWIFHYNLQWLTGDLIAGKSLRKFIEVTSRRDVKFLCSPKHMSSNLSSTTEQVRRFTLLFQAMESLPECI